MQGTTNHFITKNQQIFFLRQIRTHNERFLYSTGLLNFKAHVKEHNISIRLLYNYGNDKGSC